MKRFLCLGVAMFLAASNVIASDKTEEFWSPPPFSINDAQGQSFTYPDDLNRPTIVLFWATWCPYCKALMPHLQSILDEYGDAVNVLSLNIREEEDPVAFLDNFGYQFRLLPEADAIGDRWGVKGTPGLFLVNEQGQVVFSRGAIPREAYRLTRAESDELENVQKAARVAPLWAARLRQSLDTLLGR